MRKLDVINVELLRSLGLNLVPIPSKTKELRIEWKKYQTEKCELPCTENAALICGAISGNLVVIDIDEPLRVNEFFKDFEGVKKATLVVQTGSGGFHVYCKPKSVMPGILILNDKNHKHVGEIRGTGAYVIAAGSIHPNGNEYKIISSTTKIEEVDIDAFLISLSQFGIGTSNSLPIEDIIKGGLVKGSKNRNNALYALCRYLLEDRGLDENGAWLEVERWNNTNVPPIKDYELKASFRSAVNRAKRKEAEKPENSKDIPHLKLHEITPEHEGVLISFNAIVAGMDEERTYNKEGDFKCWTCNVEKHIIANHDRVLKSPYCSQCKKRYSIVKNSVITDSVRTVIFQEPMDEAIKGVPEIKYTKVTGTSAKYIYNGQRKQVTGILQSIPRDNKQFDENDIWINITDVKDMDSLKPIYPNQQEMQVIFEAIKDPDFIHTTLIPSFAPNIVGNNDVKEGMILSIVSGHKPGENRMESHFLIVGSPSVAKSRMLDFGHKVTQGSARAVGKGATGVGLTYSINASKDKTTFASPGPVIMANGSVCYIDELDKMNPDDRSYLHEIMEDRTCTVNKSKHHFSIPVYTTIIAMANPQHQNWLDGSSLAENINLLPTLISRFDQVWRILDKEDSILDEQIATHILKKKKGDIHPVWDIELITKYFNHVRRLEPELTEDSEKELIQFYVNTRKKTHEKGIDPRGFEGVCRMATNHAKLLLKNKVDSDDVKAVIALYKKMLYSLGLEPDKEGLDQSILFETKKSSKTRVFFETWESIKDEEGLVDSTKLLEELAKTKEFDEHSALNLFEKYEGIKCLRTKGGKYRLI